MDPQRGSVTNPHHQRALNLLTGSTNNSNRTQAGPKFSPPCSVSINDSEESVPRSAWSPDRGDLEAYIPWNYPTTEDYDSRQSGNGYHERPRRRRLRQPGWLHSLKAIVLSSWLNVLLVTIPVVWTLHLLDLIPEWLEFTLCFISLIPLSKLLDLGAENLSLYFGKDIGDLIIVTLNNSIEATLGIFLLMKWELRLLQSTIIGVIILRLLLVPGISFMIGGSRVAALELHPHLTELNHSLLTMGVLTLLLPVSFFAALDRGVVTMNNSVHDTQGTNFINDALRGHLLQVSRGISVILILVYICSRFFLHVPLHEHKDAPPELKEMVQQMQQKEPEVNLPLSIALSAITVGLTAVTTEFLVESIDPMRESFGMPEEFFGLILLPIVSYLDDFILSITFLVRKTFINPELKKASTLAENHPIELAIQFLLLWSPLLILLSWIIVRPMTLLFDLFEVTMLVGSCFLLNYVTADAKTNWAEGMMLTALYIMIALTAWFYPAQPEINAMLAPVNVHRALTLEPEFQAHTHGGSLKKAADHTSSSDSSSRPILPTMTVPSTPPVPIVSESPSVTNLTEKLRALVLLYVLSDVERLLDGLSIEQLAEELGVSESRLNDVLKGGEREADGKGKGKVVDDRKGDSDDESDPTEQLAKELGVSESRLKGGEREADGKGKGKVVDDGKDDSDDESDSDDKEKVFKHRTDSKEVSNGERLITITEVPVTDGSDKERLTITSHQQRRNRP